MSAAFCSLRGYPADTIVLCKRFANVTHTNSDVIINRLYSVIKPNLLRHNDVFLECYKNILTTFCIFKAKYSIFYAIITFLECFKTSG